MKAEERKELETNSLAEGVGRLVQRFKHRPQTSSKLLWFIVIVVLVVGLVSWWMWQNSRHAGAENWAKLETPSQQNLIELSQEPFGNTAQGRAARAQLAWHRLWTFGVMQLGGNRDQSLKNIEVAIAVYDALLAEMGDDPVLSAEMKYNAGIGTESLAAKYSEKVQIEKQLEEARKRFSELAEAEDKLEKHQKTRHGEMARTRANLLKNADSRAQVVQFYTILNSQTAFTLPQMPNIPGLKKGSK